MSTLAPTFEEAKRCPRCDKPGEDVSVRPAPNLPRGTKIHTIFCRTPFCRWQDTCWFVQENPDGTVPHARDHSGEPKHYLGFEGHNERADVLIDYVKNLRAAAERETEPGAEIRKR